VSVNETVTVGCEAGAAEPSEAPKVGKSTRRHKKKPVKPEGPEGTQPQPSEASIPAMVAPPYPPQMHVWPGYPPVDTWPQPFFHPFFSGYPGMMPPMSPLSSLSSLGTYARAPPGLRMSPSIVLAHLFHIFAEWWWRDAALSTSNSAPVRASPYLCVYVYLCLSVSAYVCVYIYLRVCAGLSLSLSLSVCVRIYVQRPPFCLRVSVENVVVVSTFVWALLSLQADSGNGYHVAPMRVYPPFGLPNENATRNVNVSTLQAIRHEILQTRRRFLDSLAEFKTGAVVDLPPQAELFWEEMFAPVDFFRRSLPVVFIMIDVRHLEPDGPSDIDYDHGVARCGFTNAPTR
jgi:hypothetical protein